MVKADIGVIGGSGFYELINKAEKVSIDTPFGPTSDKISLGLIANKKVAFIPRHGSKHSYPPHMVPYAANIYAFKKLGVTRIIAPTASGSLNKVYKPGDFVLCDQFVNFTSGRIDSFFQGNNTPRELKYKVVHISGSPYCEMLRNIAFKQAQKNNIKCHKSATVVVINGPRFASKAESVWYQSNGWGVINMTQYPEAILAHEASICYLNISLITDYDNGIIDKLKIKPVNVTKVLKVFKKNNVILKEFVSTLIKNIPQNEDCLCRHSLDNSVVN